MRGPHEQQESCLSMWPPCALVASGSFLQVHGHVCQLLAVLSSCSDLPSDNASDAHNSLDASDAEAGMFWMD